MRFDAYKSQIISQKALMMIMISLNGWISKFYIEAADVGYISHKLWIEMDAP